VAHDQRRYSLGDLKENKTYYYKVSSIDEAGNVGWNDNGGSLYTFTTLNLPPNLTVYSSNSTETYQTETAIYGTAADPSGVLTSRSTASPPHTGRATDIMSLRSLLPSERIP